MVNRLNSKYSARARTSDKPFPFIIWRLRFETMNSKINAFPTYLPSYFDIDIASSEVALANFLHAFAPCAKITGERT